MKRRHDMKSGAMLLIAIFSLSACADIGAEAPGPNLGSPPQDSLAVEAENRLFAHDVSAANTIYSDALETNPTDGTFAAGKAITDLLLIPYSEEFNRVLVDDLGARRTLDAQDNVLYREEGILDLLSRGVGFQDDGSLSGIETLLEDDLPWVRGKLDSMQTFVTGLDRPVDALLLNLVDVADAMEPIYANLEIALEDSAFGAFYVPGTVFFDDQLSLELGKSEIALLRGGVGFVRSGIYFAAAYENTWTLEEAFGPRWETIALDATDPMHEEGFTYDDYVTAFMSNVLARKIRDASLLGRSREAARQGLVNLRDSLERGIDRVENQEPNRTLSFEDADLNDARDIVDLIRAVENSLFAPTPIPFTEPDTTMDLSSFFEDGRTLPEEQEWFERTAISDEFGESVEWQLTEEAFQTFFVDAVFTPEFSSDQTPTLEIGTVDEDPGFVDAVTGDLSRTVETTYGTR